MVTKVIYGFFIKVMSTLNLKYWKFKTISLINLWKTTQNLLGRKSEMISQPRRKVLENSRKVYHESKVFSRITTEISSITRNLANNSFEKNWISAVKTSKKHNLQKWTQFVSISKSFPDISNSLNLYFSYFVKMNLNIRVNQEI